MSRQRSRDPEGRRRRIAQAAMALFRHGGFASVTMRAIAARLGCSPGAIYLHFRDKEAILAELRQEGFRLLTEALNQAVGQGSPVPGATLRQACEAYLDFSQDHPDVYELMFATQTSLHGAAGLWPMTDGAQATAQLLDLFAGLVHGAMAEPSKTTQQKVLVLWGGLHGLTLLLLAGFWRPVEYHEDPPSGPWGLGLQQALDELLNRLG